MLLGIMCMCLAGVHFSVMGGTAKLLGESYSSIQVSWARAFIHMVFLTALFVPRFGIGVLRTKRPGLQLGRAAMLTTSNLCFFYAVTFIPLAKASAISLTTPIIVALLAWPFLRERTTALRVAAMLAGFAGVLIIIRPGGEVFHIASILVVVSASAYAVYQILTRLVAPYDSPETSALWAPLTGAFLVMAALPFVWETPRSWGDAGMFFAICTGAEKNRPGSAIQVPGRPSVQPSMARRMLPAVVAKTSSDGKNPPPMSTNGKSHPIRR